MKKVNNCSLYFASHFFDRLRGLFGLRNQKAITVIVPCRSIHTCWVKRDIHVAFFDQEGAIIDSSRNVKPFKVLKNKKAYGVLEGWSNEHQEWFEVGEMLELKTKNRRK